MVENSPTFMHHTDLEQLARDIECTAEIAEVPYDGNAVWRVLNAYKDFFTGSAISFVTNTRPKENRHLAVRYVEIQVPHDAYAIALGKGLIRPQGNPIDDMLPEIQAKYQILGYGVDLSAHRGLSKIWVFFRDLPRVEEVLTLSSLPKSLKQQAKFFEKHKLKYVSLFALDFNNKSINVYFMVKQPGGLSPTGVVDMIEDADLDMPDQAKLEHCVRAVTIYPTFTWDSDKIERLCFGAIAPVPDMVPTHLHPLIEHYVKRVPFAAPNHLFIYSITTSRTGDFIKIESDYTGSMASLMRGGAEAVPEV